MKILDACCGSRMFWFDKNEPHTIYMDQRIYEEYLESGHHINVNPDIQGDFRNVPFSDNSFDLIVFDPPHLIHAGPNSWLRKKYGVLPKEWRPYLKQGFQELMRVLKPNGTMVFKWNQDQIKFADVISEFGQRPIFGDQRGNTRWVVFIKNEKY